MIFGCYLNHVLLQVARLKQQLMAAEAELNRWRKGEKVPEAEWISLLEGAAINLQLPTGTECKLRLLLIICL